MIKFDQPLTRNYGTIDSFVAYMSLDGSFIVEVDDDKVIVNKGDTILIPACINEVGLIPHNLATILEVYNP
jgi:mannose-6-phosphate isomerase